MTRFKNLIDIINVEMPATVFGSLDADAISWFLIINNFTQVLYNIGVI